MKSLNSKKSQLLFHYYHHHFHRSQQKFLQRQPNHRLDLQYKISSILLLQSIQQLRKKNFTTFFFEVILHHQQLYYQHIQVRMRTLLTHKDPCIHFQKLVYCKVCNQDFPRIPKQLPTFISKHRLGQSFLRIIFRLLL